MNLAANAGWVQIGTRKPTNKGGGDSIYPSPCAADFAKGVSWNRRQENRFKQDSAMPNGEGSRLQTRTGPAATGLCLWVQRERLSDGASASKLGDFGAAERALQARSARRGPTKVFVERRQFVCIEAVADPQTTGSALEHTSTMSFHARDPAWAGRSYVRLIAQPHGSLPALQAPGYRPATLRAPLPCTGSPVAQNQGTMPIACHRDRCTARGPWHECPLSDLHLPR